MTDQSFQFIIRSQTTQRLHNLCQICRYNSTLKVGLSISHINARSICKKINQFQEYTTEVWIEICAITETWLRSDDSLTPLGYKIFYTSRTEGRGGGIALVCLEDLIVSEYPLPKEFKTLEMAVYKIKHDSITYDLVVVYRLPSASVIKSCDEIASFIKNTVVNLKGELIVIGNFNIRMDKLEDPDIFTFAHFLSGLGLQNHMAFTAH